MNWKHVYQELMPKIYNFLRYRVGDDYVAEDLTSATFEKAWQHRKKYQKHLGDFEAWIFTIARNLATDRLRKHHAKTISLVGVQNILTSESAEQTYMTQFELARLKDSLLKLTPQAQEIVALKYGGQLTNRAIAQLLDLSETNVGSILYRSIHKLREELGKDLSNNESKASGYE